MEFENYDLVIVGAGFFGATIAERCAEELGLKIIILERRGHIGGNAYSEVNGDTGIEVHKYGAHLFHTSSDEVWRYLNRFTHFTSYQHRVFTTFQNKVFPMPINLATICQYFDRRMSPAEARLLISEQSGELGGKQPENLEEKAISLIGRPLYEAFIRGYTLKQWQTDPRELPEGIITRLPVRYNFDNRYFNDRYEGLPIDGYTTIFEKMLENENIHVATGIDYFDVKDHVPDDKTVIYTGPIDRYFDFSFGALKWRTVDFEDEIVSVGDFQGTSVMNYADEEVPFTRIIEFRHFHPERDYQNEKTIITREYSRFASAQDEPYYPINTAEDKKIYDAYRQRSELESNVIFGGRLGTYRYLDMHQAIGAALKTYQNRVRPIFVEGAPAE